MQLAAGARHTCALLDGGAVACWGDNSHGQLGVGSKNSSEAPAGQTGERLQTVDLGPGETTIVLQCTDFSANV